MTVIHEVGTVHALLRTRWRQGRHVCVGLDPVLELLPDRFGGMPPGEAVFAFNRDIIDATQDYVCAFKPNAAFYEQYGPAGLEALVATVQHIREQLPDVPVILDAKRGDIGNTNRGYAAAVFDVVGAHAVTLHPYLGREALQPFLDRADRGLFILVKTSNPGAGEFQDLPVGPDGNLLYEHIARSVAETWNGNGNCGVVVGAPYPEALARVREIVGDLPILVPGVGTQGGQLAATLRAGRDSDGAGMVINAARGILYASPGRDYAAAAGAAARQLNEAITAGLADR